MSEHLYSLFAVDTAIYTYGRKITTICKEPTKFKVHFTTWLNQSYLQPNVSKTVAMFFTKSNSRRVDPGVFVAGEKLQVVFEYKFPRVWVDSKQSFKSQVKRSRNQVKLRFSNFHFLRPVLSVQTAKVYMHAMILAHINCLVTCKIFYIETIRISV